MSASCLRASDSGATASSASMETCGNGPAMEACPRKVQGDEVASVELWRAGTQPAATMSLLVLRSPRPGPGDRLSKTLEAAGLLLIEQIHYHDPLEIIDRETAVDIVLVEAPGDAGALARLSAVAGLLVERPWVQVLAAGQADFAVAAAVMKAGATAFLPLDAASGDVLVLLDELERKARDRRQRFEAAYDMAATRKALAGKLQALVREFEALIDAPGRTGTSRQAAGSIADDRIGLLRLTRFVLDSRASRDRIFGGSLFSDPCWEILLELTRAHLAGTAISASGIGGSSRMPLSTTLRKLDELVAHGLVERHPDPADARRKLLRLTDSGFASMWQFLDALSRAAHRLSHMG
ncbi:winged helix DNA-binding protein [Geminicoccaceae bacterium 1502E]|nr:winged helix DNA-binding protein [Geminicoccaceae bacterium 1502E]